MNSTAVDSASVEQRRLATALVISRIRWLFIPLAFIGVAGNVPAPTNLPVFLGAIAVMIVCNVALTVHAWLPPRLRQPLIAVLMMIDVLIVGITMFEFARDPSDLGWAFLMLTGPAAAVLYGWRGLVAFGPMMVLALLGATLAGDQFVAANGVVGFLHKALEVLGVTVIVAALAEQNERQRARVEAANAELARLTVTDPLTGLANRRLFESGCKDEYRRSARSGAAVSVVIADIDHFKQVNDRHGHPTGDEVLRRVAAAIRGCAREVDLVARIGGEEFAVVLPDTNADGAAVFAERARLAVSDLDFSLLALHCTISGGVASGAGSSLETVLAEADRALYRAKARGRNRTEIWHGEETIPVHRASKADLMRDRFAAGQTVEQVVHEFGVSRRVAFGVLKRWQLTANSAPAHHTP